VVVSDILDEYTQPAKPSGLEVIDTSAEEDGLGTNSGATSPTITVDWTGNETFTDPSIRSYDVEWKGPGTGGSYGTEWTSNPHTIPVYGNRRLEEGEPYDIRVETFYYQHRNGSQSTRIRSGYTSDITEITPMQVPTNLSDSNITTSSFDTNWEPRHTNGDQAVYRRDADGFSGMEFNGNSDYVISENSGPSGDPAITMSVWAKPDTTNQSDWAGIFSLGTDQSTNTTFTITTDHSGGKIELHTWGNSTPGVSLDDTNLHHYVAVNTGSGEQRFYVDGNLIGSMNENLDIPDEPVVIGARKYTLEDNLDQFWDGKIRDAKIYDRVLSDSEISSIYNGNPPTSGLINYWPLDLNNSGTTPDVSAYANNGTINGPTLTGSTPTKQRDIIDYFGDLGGFRDDMEFIGSDGPFGRVWKADATTNSSYEDITTGQFRTSDFTDTGQNVYYYFEFYAKWNERPTWGYGQDIIVNPAPDPNNYQRYVYRSDGQNGRDEYFRLYYGNDNDTAVAKIAQPHVTKDQPWSEQDFGGLTEGDTFETFVQAETEHSQTRDN
jgi:hypothetical protein